MQTREEGMMRKLDFMDEHAEEEALASSANSVSRPLALRYYFLEVCEREWKGFQVCVRARMGGGSSFRP